MSVTDESEFTRYVPPPCEEEVEVLFVDDEILIVSKPAGLLSVPGRFLKDSVLRRLLYEYPDARIVHRLDLDTSGLMVLALSQLATSDLNRQFRERIVEKTYIADVWGEMTAASGEIDLPLRPDPSNRPKQIVDHELGKSALTRFEKIQADDKKTRVRLKPVTGRSHQLRLHLAAIDHPILGCDLYAHEDAFKASPRLCLHAQELGILHPGTGEMMVFRSPAPWVAA
ncbi:MAG: RluA family pseudouridine synthase [Gammaproteobacteria bacterium]|jgi:tRNA pseudouridine32 synthase / 23S rRNA pseudouridine746 synthase|nr:RluA family pseudouridine synthase [Gammaproteobacteria bacterium]MBT4493569.1 RluA family pseudouridine synthase [Gammaproteobacteria bacterium]MBT7371604.1 RluA family pseudouridine synthase [Gammaproteobacteria bacterium]